MSYNTSPSYFSSCHDFQVGNLTVTNPGSYRERDEKAFDLLHDSIAIDAAHNSEERCDAPTCHPETRRAIQAEIFSWIGHGDEDDEPKKILWLSGPAGAGKTAIAGSLADTCDEQGILAGSYFFASFTGSEQSRSKRYLVATLVYHLILPLDEQHPLRRAILMAVMRDPSIFRRRLKDQFRVLLVKPFQDSRHQFDKSHLPKVFIIDGLDEVEATGSRQLDFYAARLANEKDQEEIVTALSYAFSAGDGALPFRVIVASRPERAIQTFFTVQAPASTRSIFLDENYDPDSDIALYLNAEFAAIRRGFKLATSWPSKEVIQQLVVKSSGQFIYAVTVIRFLQSTRQPNPIALLNTLLDQSSSDYALNALAPLHALYTRVFMSSADPYMAIRWIGAIQLFAGEIVPSAFLRQLLQDYDGEAEYLFEHLTSLVCVPPLEDLHSPYRLYHKSLVDFLENDTHDVQFAAFYRSGRMFVNRKCSAVLKAKSPSVAGTERQLAQFLRTFTFFIMGFFNVLQCYDDTDDGLLVQCDVAWWVHKAVTVAFIDSMFRNIHSMVRSSVHLDKVPRQGPTWLFAPMQALEEQYPSSLQSLGRNSSNRDLLRETMGLETKVIHTTIPKITLPSSLTGFNRTTSTEPIVTVYTVDEDYEATLNAVADMYSRLPAGWASVCKDKVTGETIGLHKPLDYFIQQVKLDSDISSDVNP